MEFFRVETKQQAQDLCKIMPDVVAIDTEYVTGDPRTTRLLKVIIADSTRSWAILPALLYVVSPTLLTRRVVFLQDYNHCDTMVLLKHGCDLRQVNCYNLIDMHHLLDENANHDLGTRVLQEFNDDYKRIFWGKYKNYEDASEDEQLEYECKDGVYTYLLGLKDFETLHRDDMCDTSALFYHRRKLSAALFETELNGLPVNVPLIEETKAKMLPIIEGLPAKLRENFNEYCTMWELDKWVSQMERLKTLRGKFKCKRPIFSFASGDQLASLLFEYLGLPVLELTPKKNPKTDYDTLVKLSEDHPIVKPLLEYAEVKNIYGTFVEGLLERVSAGRIYPHFNVSGTKTGRISHSDPNMGNLPKEGVYRNFFIPTPGYKIIGADYAQLEVVVEYGLTGDTGLHEIIFNGASKHDLFKAELDKSGFNLPRSQVKNVNFALQYDAQAPKIAKMVGCSVGDAERIIGVFYNKFSGVKKLKSEVSAKVIENWQVTNLAGQTRRFEPSNNKYAIAKAQRQAYNFLIQGVAGEACNRAFYRFSTWCQSEGVGRALFSVHDEIVAEVQDDHVESAKAMLTSIMEQSSEDFSFPHPIKLEAKPYGGFTCWQKT